MIHRPGACLPPESTPGSVTAHVYPITFHGLGDHPHAQVRKSSECGREFELHSTMEDHVLQRGTS